MNLSMVKSSELRYVSDAAVYKGVDEQIKSSNRVADQEEGQIKDINGHEEGQRNDVADHEGQKKVEGNGRQRKGIAGHEGQRKDVAGREGKRKDVADREGQRKDVADHGQRKDIADDEGQKKDVIDEEQRNDVIETLGKPIKTEEENEINRMTIKSDDVIDDNDNDVMIMAVVEKGKKENQLKVSIVRHGNAKQRTEKAKPVVKNVVDLTEEHGTVVDNNNESPVIRNKTSPVQDRFDNAVIEVKDQKSESSEGKLT